MRCSRISRAILKNLRNSAAAGSAVLVVALLLGAGFAYAATPYSNDSDSIDINYPGGSYVPPPEPEEETVSEDEEAAAGGENEETVTDEAETSFEEESPDVTIPVAIESEPASEGSQSASGQDGGSPDTATGEGILNSLFGNQALFFGGGSSVPGTKPETITLSGKKVRDALKSQGISALNLGDLLNRRFSSKKDFALVAASSILENDAIEEVILTLDSLELSYRAEGRLFAVFPFSYPIRVTISPHAGTAAERVIVRFPWYRFFLLTYVSRQTLQSELDAVIESVKNDSGTETMNARTHLFIEISEAIEARFDTVQGSVY